MKKKYIKTTVIIVLILFLITCGPILMTYKPSRLVCVGEIEIHENQIPIGFENGFGWTSREGFEKCASGWFDLNQQEIDELMGVINQYENYQTIIFSRIKSRELWTRRGEPHIGYMNLHEIKRDGKTQYDNVFYVYVTKETEIDYKPMDWEWR